MENNNQSLEIQPYQSEWKFPKRIESFLKGELESPSLNVFSGTSAIGDIQLDLIKRATIRGTAFQLPFASETFQTVLADPPWKLPIHLRGPMMYELRRVARKNGRIILDAPWYPNNLRGCRLSFPIYITPTNHHFGNSALISIYDKLQTEIEIGIEQDPNQLPLFAVKMGI